MARSVPAWERLKPSIGSTGNPGWRLLSHDGNTQQAAIYRKNEGPWSGASIYCEWHEEDGQPKRWLMFLRDRHDRFLGPVHDEHFEPALHALNDLVVDRSLDPLF